MAHSKTIASAICEALGLEGQRVARIDIAVEPVNQVKVTVVIRPDSEQMARVIEQIKGVPPDCITKA